jgi:hypothetical protein
MRTGSRTSRTDSSDTLSQTSAVLRLVLIVYAIASLVHFVHNAEHLADYPNLPDWISRARIYGAWLCITAVGLVGYLLQRAGHQRVGLAVLTLYAANGFDGLLHYSRAPFAAHTAAMNASIWLEALAAALLVGAIVRHAVLNTRRARRAASYSA